MSGGLDRNVARRLRRADRVADWLDLAEALVRPWLFSRRSLVRVLAVMTVVQLLLLALAFKVSWGLSGLILWAVVESWPILVYVGWRWIGHGLFLDRIVDAKCAACGYGFWDHAPPNCPECNASWREHGGLNSEERSRDVLRIILGLALLAAGVILFAVG